MEKIFDFHAHIFPEKIARKAAEATGQYYGIPMAHGGTAAELLESGRAAGFSAYLVCSTATVPEQVRSVNDFLAGQAAAHPEFCAFGTLHPGMSGAELREEVTRIEALGLRGVKVHPDFQGFRLDSPEAFRLFEAVGSRLPVLTHMGDLKTDNTTPERFSRVLDAFPDTVFIGAHLGGYSVWDEAAELLAGRKLYVDTSSSLEFLAPERAALLIRAFGAEYCLFGTDYPMWDAAEELARFDRLGLSEEERGMILWGNAAALLGL